MGKGEASGGGAVVSRSPFLVSALLFLGRGTEKTGERETGERRPARRQRDAQERVRGKGQSRAAGARAGARVGRQESERLALAGSARARQSGSAEQTCACGSGAARGAARAGRCSF